MVNLPERHIIIIYGCTWGVLRVPTKMIQKKRETMYRLCKWTCCEIVAAKCVQPNGKVSHLSTRTGREEKIRACSKPTHTLSYVECLKLACDIKKHYKVYIFDQFEKRAFMNITYSYVQAKVTCICCTFAFDNLLNGCNFAI